MMTRGEAIDYAEAFMCCTFGDENICEQCVYHGTKKCREAEFDTKGIREVIDAFNKTKNIKMSKIIISDGFKNNPPCKSKLDKCRENYLKYGVQDRWIVINESNILIDGYVMYLVLKEFGVTRTPVKISNYKRECWKKKDLLSDTYRNNMTTYIYGHHPNSVCTKSYVWRIPNEEGNNDKWEKFSNKIKVGDRIYCDTKFGVSPVIVDSIEITDKCPCNYPVKVVKCRRIKHSDLIAL